MPGVSRHGGGCCGIRHITGFGYKDANSIKELDWCIKSVLANRLMEVTLTDSQLKVWWPELKKRGFKQKTRFRNSNSGNHVTVLHLIRKPAPLKDGEVTVKDAVKSFQPCRDAFGRFASPTTISVPAPARRQSRASAL